MKQIKKLLPEILLILIIPILTAGFNWFESTSIYRNFIGASEVDYAIRHKLQGLNFSSTTQSQYVLMQADPEFNDVWKLIKENSGRTFPNQEPKIIAVLAPFNPYYVELPFGEQLSKAPLIPNNDFIIVGFCYWNPTDSNSDCSTKNSYNIGTLDDLKVWNQTRVDSWRNNIEMFFALISFIIGLVYLKNRRNPE